MRAADDRIPAQLRDELAEQIDQDRRHERFLVRAMFVALVAVALFVLIRGVLA